MYDGLVGIQAHIEVFQLGLSRGLVHKLQYGAQIADIDAPLVQGFCQCGPIHGQGAVIQAIFHLKLWHTNIWLKA